ncbi:MAG: M48 family metallopeptidase [Rubellimicrobium sp.]|nr:M48 family metallopeptidase [Rubellimicrobium sp.]
MPGSAPTERPTARAQGQIGAPADFRQQARMFIAVVDAVEPVAEAECRARNPRVNCDFQIVVDDRPGMPPNAFQTVDRSGRPIIAFTLAMIADVRNPDELAFIMSHEAAHHILDHLDRQARNAAMGAAVFGQLAGVGGRTASNDIRTAERLGAAVGARSFSREFELEADALGTVIAARAGFNPLLGAEFFNRIPDPGNRFLATHPPNSERLAVVREVASGLGL